MSILFNSWIIRTLIALRVKCIWVKKEHCGKVQWIQCNKISKTADEFRLIHYSRLERAYYSFWSSNNSILELEDLT